MPGADNDAAAAKAVDKFQCARKLGGKGDEAYAAILCPRFVATSVGGAQVARIVRAFFVRVEEGAFQVQAQRLRTVEGEGSLCNGFLGLNDLLQRGGNDGGQESRDAVLR